MRAASVRRRPGPTTDARPPLGLRGAFGIIRIVVAVTAIVALVGDINFTIGTSPLAISNFFSYFTVQSMMLATIVFVLGAIYALRGKRDALWLDMVRAFSTTYVVVSGIVFAFILFEGARMGIPVWAPWSSILLHFVIPVYAIADWVIAPGRDVPWRTSAFTVVFPAIWVLYTMIRGEYVYWYPYFFLDPAVVGTPLQFALYLLAIAAVFGAVTTALIFASRRIRIARLRRRRARRHPQSPHPRKAQGLREPRQGTPNRQTPPGVPPTRRP